MTMQHVIFIMDNLTPKKLYYICDCLKRPHRLKNMYFLILILGGFEMFKQLLLFISEMFSLLGDIFPKISYKLDSLFFLFHKTDKTKTSYISRVETGEFS